MSWGPELHVSLPQFPEIALSVPYDWGEDCEEIKSRIFTVFQQVVVPLFPDKGCLRGNMILKRGDVVVETKQQFSQLGRQSKSFDVVFGPLRTI